MTDEKSRLHEPVTYYAFAEEVTAFLPDASLDGPDGAPLHEPPYVLDEPFVRGRFSGIRASHLPSMRDHVALTPDLDLTDERRAMRRTQLNRAFEEVPVPVIDVFWPRDFNSLTYRWKGRRRRPAPGVWFQLTVRQGGAREAPFPVLVGETEPDLPPDEFGSGKLVGITRPPPEITAILKNIFSLDHIPDADLEEDPDGPDFGAPPSGGTPTDTRMAEERTTRERSHVAEEVWALSAEARLAGEDDRQHVVVRR